MRTRRGFARFACLLGVSTVLAATPARAQLWVLGTPAEPAAVERAELAYALGDGTAATWLSLRVKRGPVAVLAALGEGARAETAIDGWFIALEDAASPSIVPPRGSDDCRALRPYVRTTWPRSQGVAATELKLESARDMLETLSAEGLRAPPALPEATSYVVWLWPERGEAFTTRTLRIVGSSALGLSPGPAFPVSVSALGNGPLGFEAEVPKHALPITYVAGERPSADYGQRLAEFLSETGAPLVEARAHGLLFDWSIYADVISVAPLVRSYADRAGNELPDLDSGACREQLTALREAGAPPVTACAEALDAGLALGMLDPARVTLQRFQLLGGDGVLPELLQAGGEASPPFMRAQSFDGSACASEELPPLVVNQPPVTREPGGSTAPAVVVEETVVIEDEPVEIDCGGEPHTEADYGYYEDDDDVDCSSDTSSSSDEDCSSDTSSSSDGTGDEVDCASDSSSSTESDDGCSGDSSSESGGYDGDTCTGSAAPEAQTSALHSAGARPVRPARLKISAWALGFAALVLPIRRRKRRPNAGG